MSISKHQIKAMTEDGDLSFRVNIWKRTAYGVVDAKSKHRGPEIIRKLRVGSQADQVGDRNRTPGFAEGV